MLHGADLTMAYWLEAFYHYLCLHNVTPHNDNDKMPFEVLNSRKPDLLNLCTFESRVYVWEDSHQCHCGDMYTWLAIFLGYTTTMSQVIYLNIKTGWVKQVKHAQFDEAMFGETIITPNACQLWSYAG